MYLIPKYKERILENIKSSSFYNKNNYIYHLIADVENNKNYSNDVLLKYYSLSRFEKLILWEK